MKNQTSQPVKSSFDMISWISAGVAVLVIFLLRMRLNNIPFERDEGEFAYMGQIILKGLMPYAEAYNMKLPGTYYMYALIIKIFGSSPSEIHMGLMLCVGATMLMMYYVFKNFLNAPLAVSSSFIYGLMASSKSTLGFAGHATHFVILFFMAGLVFWTLWTKSNKIYHVVLFGVMTGLSFLMKQHGVFFIIAGGIMVLTTLYFEQKASIMSYIKNGASYSVGVFIPYLMVVALMYFNGNFDKFWFWTVEYAQKYTTSIVQLKDAPVLFNLSFKQIWGQFPLVWITSILGLVVLWISSWSTFQKIVVTLIFLFAFLTICPGMYFRQHYFLTWLPFVALFSGITLHWVNEKLKFSPENKAYSISFFIFTFIIFFFTLQKDKAYWFDAKPNVINKSIYGTNPFVESIEIAKYIKANSQKDDKIAVLGSEPQIMVYADRLSATGHIYTYGMMEKHDYNVKMQEEMIAEIESDKPKFIVYCKVGLSWLEYPDSPRKIFEWMPKYIDANYEMVGQVEVSNQNFGEFYWDAAAKNRQPKSENHIIVFKRKV